MQIPRVFPSIRGGPRRRRNQPVPIRLPLPKRPHCLRHLQLLRPAAALAALLAASSCALLPFPGGKSQEDDDERTPTSEQLLYERAEASLRAENFAQSIVALERLEARFPFGRYAEQAQLELIYAHHMARDLDAAHAAAERFIRLHPQHPKVDYAYYMRALTTLTRDRGSFSRFLRTDVSRRDVSNLRRAFADFGELLARHPRSEYARDARQRMIHLRNVLAEAEVNIAVYYIGRGANIAAANRARHVVENYPRTSAVPDALAVLIEANWKLGLEDAANDALKVLAHNFPDYRGFDDSGQLVLQTAIRERRRSWVNLMTFGLFDRPDAPPPLRFPRESEPS